MPHSTSVGVRYKHDYEVVEVSGMEAYSEPIPKSLEEMVQQTINWKVKVVRVSGMVERYQPWGVKGRWFEGVRFLVN
jgi:hypothetical protein